MPALLFFVPFPPRNERSHYVAGRRMRGGPVALPRAGKKERIRGVTGRTDGRAPGRAEWRAQGKSAIIAFPHVEECLSDKFLLI
jgi:hypothetical protein